MKRRLYIEMAILCLALSFISFLLKFIRIPGDGIIARYPDTTLHDMIYFCAESFVNLFGLMFGLNLCYFIESIYKRSAIVRFMTTIVMVLSSAVLFRTMGNFITYYEVSGYEIVVDIITALFIFIFRYLYNYISHAAVQRTTATTTGAIPTDH